MRKLVSILLIFVCFRSLSCQVTLGLEDFSPQSEKVSDSSWQGRDLELIEKFLTLAGCSFDIVELPWARGLSLLTTGEIDMMINVTKTPQRAEVFHFIGPINYEVIVLASKKDEILSLERADDLLKLDKPVAIQRGAYYGETVSQLIATTKGHEQFIEVTDNETKMALMKSGRIAGFLEAKRNLTLGPQLKPRYEGVWFQPLILHQTDVHYAFSKQSISPQLLNKLQLAYQQLFFTNTRNKNKQNSDQTTIKKPPVN